MIHNYGALFYVLKIVLLHVTGGTECLSSDIKLFQFFFEECTEFRMIGNKSVRFHNKFVLVNKIEIFDSCTYIVGTGNLGTKVYLCNSF